MIIYGTGSKNLGEVKISNERCPSCNEQNNIHIHGIVKYFTFFWIPIFPYNKKIIPICHSCDVEISKKQISPSLKDKISLEKSKFSIPFHLFIGLIIIISFIGFMVYESSKHDEFVSERIHNLQIEDIIVLKSSPSEYNFIKINEVEKDTVYFNNSNYSIDSKPTKSDYTNGLIEKEDFFSKEIYYYTIKEIDSLHTIGELDIFELNN